VGIPGNNEHFCFDSDARRERSLASFSIATCGIFVFVRIATAGASLKEFLGRQWATLEALSRHFGAHQPIDIASFPWKTNWKIAVESVLEVYHVDTVHPETFKKLVKSFWRFQDAGAHSTAQSLLREDMTEWWDKAISRLGLAKVPGMDQYDHLMIFPNMAIGVTRGSLASVQTYEPTGLDSCTLRFRMLLANSDQPSKVGGLIWKSVAQTITEFNRKLLDEDRVASENSQAGLRQASRPAILGINEGRIRLFHDAVARYMDASVSTPVAIPEQNNRTV
jgi:phenylpropionate dioxygenase-like ring-hydroxylating dioxygenase large terminal subunit